MDVQSIPRTFWHSVSFAIITLTVGLVLIFFMSENISVNWKHLNIQKSNMENLQESLQAQEATINKKNEEVLELKRLLDEQLAELNTVKAELADLQESSQPATRAKISSTLDKIASTSDYEYQVQEKLTNIDNLQLQSFQQKQIYNQQQQIFDRQQTQQQLQQQLDD